MGMPSLGRLKIVCYREPGPGAALVARCAMVCVLLAGGMGERVFADGLPNEYLITQRWRELFMLNSPVGNPAYLTEADYIALRGAFSPTLQAEFLLWELGATVPIGLHQAAGFSWLGVNEGEVEESDIDPAGGFAPSGRIATNSKSFFLLTYAVNPWRRLSVGANVTVAYERNFGNSLSGIGLDIGATYRLLNHPLLGEHILGVSALNLIAPAMEDNPQPSISQVGAYSRDLKLSWYGTFWQGRIESGIDFDFKDFFAHADEFVDWDENAQEWGDGEGALEWGLSFRAGGWILRLLKAYVQLGFNDDGFDYWGVAAGLNVPTLNRGRDLSVLYQYNLLSKGSRASTHTVYAYGEFGQLRGERHARRLAQLLNVSPNTLYTRALELYHKGQYWDAFFLFGQIPLLYPDFFKMDWVHYYMGSCQEEMDMRRAADDRYRDMIRAFSTSPARHHAQLGLMRIRYRNADAEGVEAQFRTVTQSEAPDSLKHHAYYLMGEALAYRRMYREALEYLLEVPHTHPEYVFARHSAALAYFHLGEDTRALQNLEECVLAKTNTEAQEEIVYRSYALVGFYFYEQDKLGKAVAALRKVPKDSYHYEDALLGIGWCALKAQRWEDCLRAARDLRRATAHPVLKGEAVILESYSYLRQEQFVEAAALLSSAYEAVKKLEPPDNDSLRTRRERYMMDRVVYDSLTGEVNRYARLEQLATTIPELEPMHQRQMQLKSTLEDYYRFRDESVRNSYFSRSIQQVKDDIEYLYAFAVRKAGEQKNMQQEFDALRKKSDIDADIERLKDELKRLEKAREEGEEQTDEGVEPE